MSLWISGGNLVGLEKWQLPALYLCALITTYLEIKGDKGITHPKHQHRHVPRCGAGRN